MAGRPCSTACLGRIRAYFRLSDGTYNVLVLGLRRVELLENLSRTQADFRVAQVALCDDLYSARPLAHGRALQREFRDALQRFLPRPSGRPGAIGSTARRQRAAGHLRPDRLHARSRHSPEGSRCWAKSMSTGGPNCCWPALSAGRQ